MNTYRYTELLNSYCCYLDNFPFLILGQATLLLSPSFGVCNNASQWFSSKYNCIVRDDSLYIETPERCIILIRLVFLRMATSEPLPQRPTHKSRRLQGQEPQQVTPEKVVGSVAMPPSGGALPLQGPHSLPGF